MDSYDEVHDVRNGREISTPEMEVGSAIKFVNSEADNEKDELDSSNRLPEEVKICGESCGKVRIIFDDSRFM